LRHLTIEHWALRSSPLHRVYAGWKLIALLLILLLARSWPFYAGLIVFTGVVVARLPLGPFLLRSLLVLPFVGVFALSLAWQGDGARAYQLLAASYASALAVLLTAGTTPMPHILATLRSVGVPAFLLDVVQFVYRYLHVLMEQAQRMRVASEARGASRSRAAAAGNLSVLFARSLQRAEGVERAILSRK
jgi:cobalt/nickel transport system permease protein